MAKARAQVTISRIIDIASVTRYYLLQASTLSVPVKPTANPPGGNWVTEEPSYTAGSTNTLYLVDQTIFTNAAFSYSAVSKSSSYEAAKAAYNKAVSVEASLKVEKDRITSIVTEVHDMEIGGRNLLRFTGDMPLTGNALDPSTATGFSAWGTGTMNLSTTTDGLKLTRANRSSDSFHVPIVSLGCVENGEEVTLSFEYKSNTSIAGQAYFIQSSGNNISVAMPDLVINETKWQTYEFTFSNANSNVRTFKSFLLCYGIIDTGTWIEVRKGSLKLELGNKKTAWTPASEDLEKRVASAETTINQNSTDITLRATKTEMATAKNEAINAAASDATTKSNNALASAKTYSDAQLKVQADRITANVAETGKLGTRMSTVEQTANGLEVKLESTEIEGRNMLSDTNVGTLNAVAGKYGRYLSDDVNAEYIIGDFIEISDPPIPGIRYAYKLTAWSTVGSRFRGLAWYGGGFIPMTSGSKYTLSCYARVVSGISNSYLMVGSSPYDGTEIAGMTKTWKRVSKTFTYNTATHGGSGGCRIYAGIKGTDGAGVLELCGFKLEKGTVATNYVPYSPEEILDAAGAASNYMNFSSGGLTIGDMTKDTLGNNVKIDNDSVDICNGNTVLASYGGNTTYIGKNNANSTIDIANGNLKITAAEISDYNARRSNIISERNWFTLRAGTNNRYGNIELSTNYWNSSPTAKMTAYSNGEGSAQVLCVSNYGGGSVMLDAPYIMFNGYNMGDFVHIQGRSGMWTYRKWNSGVAELWARNDYGNDISCTSGYENAKYYTTGDWEFPFSFTAIPVATVTVWSGSGLIKPSIHTLTNHSMGMWFDTPKTSSTFAIRPGINMHIYGRWK